ncbi:uncharacterized protein BT62DRAFT_990149 [Guyanagaster necrorhizus]|uniref:Uncharacterized protein n=1 Tax=Guyanagaster necrorhizus TaxID=856835 RepID=A0A9P7W696_9AGAR|nr:uncharacterized protein BT62DRAFT_990149 [Guyanagaster necrorhizus MCA 3950]KAG7453250.1 hypothetical protein BT62DRAFT_990149 [Guyanagaster necrorhizus MCA 3950]
MSSDRVFINILESYLNEAPLGAFFHGIYTCTLAVTLWVIARKGKQMKARNAMVSIIVILYILATIYVAADWSSIKYTFIDNGETLNTELQALTTSSSHQWHIYHWLTGLTSGLATTIADAIMIWRCWVIWGGRYEFIALQTLLLFSQNVFGLLAILDNIHGPDYGPISGNGPIAAQEVEWTTIYLSLSLGTTLLCTVLIIYRIIMAGKSSDNIGAYHRIIEIVVESASLYAFSLIFWMVFILCNNNVSPYPQVIYVSITGFAPTLIVGRVASGQSRPNDSWKSSSVSMMQFGGHSALRAAEGTSSNSHEVSLGNGGLEREDSCHCDSAFGDSRHATVDLESN